jgi:trehalose 6-phosphate synthase
MDVGEMIERMQRMRSSVKEHNIYWWAGSLIGQLCELRLKKTTSTKTSEVGTST